MGLPTRRRLNENAESSDIRAPDGCVKVCFRENADGVS